MAEWKKTNEVWFGDSFNRDSVLCSADIAYDTALDSDCTGIKAISWDSNSATLTCNNIAVNQGILDSIGYNTYATKTDIDTVSDRFTDLQAQINDLKKKLETKKECSKLRSALKTLHYKREVE